jgi:hypothetical protein
MAPGTTIEKIYLPQTNKMPAPGELAVKTSEQNERDHILAVLEKCNGKIRGPCGAAELLIFRPPPCIQK